MISANIAWLTKIIQFCVVALTVMMRDLLKIQQDMSSPNQQKQQRPQKLSTDEDDIGVWVDPNDWLADVPKFGFYHRGYTTNHWLQVFRPIKTGC